MLEINFSRYEEERLHDHAGHLCDSSRMQADWKNAGFTKFEKVRLKFLSAGESTNTFKTVNHYDYMEQGPLITGRAEIERGVKFSVKAENDIHISLSGINPISENSWEIVLGGWGGLMSVIRSEHQGTHLAEVKHTKKQFLEVI